MEDLVIVGLGETAEHVCHFVEEYSLYKVRGFAVDKDFVTGEEFMDKPVYNLEDLDAIVDKQKTILFVAMLWNNLNGDRKRLYERLKYQGYRFANLISPSAKIRGTLTGDNCWFHDYTIVQYGAIIGSDVMVMAHSMIGAKTQIGNHCFLGTKCVVAGECKVGEQTFIGINSVVFDARVVGNKCIVGACAAVKRDLPDFAACVVSADNVMIKQYDEAIIESKLHSKQNRH